MLNLIIIEAVMFLVFLILLYVYNGGIFGITDDTTILGFVCISVGFLMLLPVIGRKKG